MTFGAMLRYVVVLMGLLCSSAAHAAIEDSGLLNDVTQRFFEQSSTWGEVIKAYATWLFWLLATISMVWTFGLMALRRADIGEFFAEFIRFTMTTGLFWWLLSNGPAMAMAVINSLRKIGADAGHLPRAISPSTPVSIGFDIVKKAFTGLSWVHPIDNLGIVLVSAAVVLAMAVVAANVLIALVTAWVMAYAGVFILGFGGARWTSDMAIGYFKAMLGMGMELMTMTLLVAVAVSVIDGFYHDLDGSSIYELLLVLCVCVVLALLIDKIPSRVAALVGGGSGAGVGAGTVLGGAAIASAALATGGAALLSVGANLAGGGQALMSAFSKAMASEGSVGMEGPVQAASRGLTGSETSGATVGAGNFAAAMGDGGAQTDSGGGRSSASVSAAISKDRASDEDAGSGFNSDTEARNSASSANQNSSPFSTKSVQHTGAGAVAAKAGRIAAVTAGNLAQGVWDVAKAKGINIKDSAMERISQTAGGKIASAVNGLATASKSGEAATFGDDSLSAGTQVPNAESEVAAFRDRKPESE